MPLLQKSTMVCGWIDTEWKPWLCQELSQANRSQSSVPHHFPHYLNTSWTHSIFQLKKAAQQGQGEGRAGLTFCQVCKPDKLHNHERQHNTTLVQEHSSEAGSFFSYKGDPFIQSYRKAPQDAQNHYMCVTLHQKKKNQEKMFLFCWILFAFSLQQCSSCLTMRLYIP